MNQKRIIFLSILIIGVLTLSLGVTFAIFNFNKTSTNSKLIVGDIYMHYNETNQIAIENAMPSDTYNSTNYFEFTVDGKNTTTDTKLYELEKDTYIADTPGFSSFEISEIESTELEKYFREFLSEVSNCEFVGCTHIKEQNCGVKRAVEDGRISQERYERFCKIYDELKDREKNRW